MLDGVNFCQSEGPLCHRQCVCVRLDSHRDRRQENHWSLNSWLLTPIKAHIRSPMAPRRPRSERVSKRKRQCIVGDWRCLLDNQMGARFSREENFMSICSCKMDEISAVAALLCHNYYDTEQLRSKQCLMDSSSALAINDISSREH